MANRGTYDLRVIGGGRVLVTGSFRPQGSGSLVNADTAPTRSGDRAFSVARTSLGLYTVTFADKWIDMESCFVSVRGADGFKYSAQGGDYSASSRTLQIRTHGPQAGSGHIPLDITTAKIIAGDVIGNTTEGLLPDGNTAPSLQRVNGATDKALRVIWASSSSVEIQFAPFVYPTDLDDASALTVHMLAAMAGATDTPTMTVGYYEGVGDTNAGGATAAITGTTVTEYTRTIAAADIGAHPKAATVCLTPGAHTTDALHLYGAWCEYTSTKGGALMDLADDVDNRVSFACVFRNTSVGGAAAT